MYAHCSPVQIIFKKKLTTEITFSFAWNNKPPKIKKSTLISIPRNGVLKIKDFPFLVKPLQLLMLNDSDQTWTLSEVIPRYVKNLDVSINHIFHCNFESTLLGLGTANCLVFYKVVVGGERKYLRRQQSRWRLKYFVFKLGE